MKDKKIQWHPGFVAAMNLEFEENREDLIYEKEFNLNTKPLEIDLLIIKKEPGVQIVNEIGRLFRGHNILEYKSPRDRMDIDTFYKASAYGCLYKSSSQYINGRPADDITITMIRDTKPRHLFQYFEEHQIKIENPYPGIYYIFDAVLFPTQVIVGKELNRKEHAWIKALSDQVEKQDMRELMERIYRLSGEFERELAESVLEVSIQANMQTIKEMRGDDTVGQALLEIMEPEIKEIIGAVTRDVTQKVTKEVTREVTKEVTAEVTREVTAEVTREVKKKVTRSLAEETAVKMLKSGKFTVEEIHEYVPWLSVGEIEELVLDKKGL